MSHVTLLTKYECARVLGMRYLQLQQGDATIASRYENGSARAAVVRELLDGQNPLMLRRVMPDGSTVEKRVRELRISEALREQLLYVIDGC